MISIIINRSHSLTQTDEQSTAIQNITYYFSLLLPYYWFKMCNPMEFHYPCSLVFVCGCVVGVDEEQRRNLILRGIPSVCAQSALWDKSVRENVTNNKISEKVLPTDNHIPCMAYFMCLCVIYTH